MQTLKTEFIQSQISEDRRDIGPYKVIFRLSVQMIRNTAAAAD